MSELTLVSTQERPLRPLVEAALAGELRLPEAGIHRTEQRLNEFEREHGMSTTEFISRYESGGLAENLELAEWVGEHRLLTRLREKADALRGIRFAD